LRLSSTNLAVNVFESHALGGKAFRPATRSASSGESFMWHNSSRNATKSEKRFSVCLLIAAAGGGGSDAHGLYSVAAVIYACMTMQQWVVSTS
jgi:hypothetical protein